MLYPLSSSAQKLATVETVLFPTKVAPRHLLIDRKLEAFILHKANGQRIDGDTASGVSSMEIDEGIVRIEGKYFLALGKKKQPYSIVGDPNQPIYLATFDLEFECEGENEYVVKGQMLGRDLSYGIEIWVENKTRGLIVIPPKNFDVEVTNSSNILK